MNVQLVVFDLAGTTVLDPGGVNGCFLRGAGGCGSGNPREDVDAVMGLPKLEAVQMLLRQYHRDDLLTCAVEIHYDFKARMINYYRTDTLVGEVPGTTAVFRLLKQHGVAIAVNTGFGEITNVLLDRLGLRGSELIDASICSDEVARGRPHPDMIETLMMQLNVADPKQVAKIGDTPSDLGEGTAAGCGWVIGVTQGSHTKAQMEGIRTRTSSDSGGVAGSVGFSERRSVNVSWRASQRQSDVV